MPTGVQGAPVTVDASYENGSAVLVDPDTPTVTVYDANGVTFAASVVPTRDAVGLYHYTFTLPVDAATGQWRAVWRGIIDGVLSEGGEWFEVIEPGSVGDPDLVVSVANLALYLGVTFTPEQEPLAAEILGWYQSEMELWLGRKLLVRARTETVVLQRDQSQVFLAATPVLSIASVVINPTSPSPTTLAAGSYVAWSWGLTFAANAYPLTFAYDTGFEGPQDGAQMQVTYTGGLDGPNIPVVVGVIKRAAAREWKRRCTIGLTSYGAEGGNYSFDDGGFGFMPAELEHVRRLKRRIVA